MHAICFNRKSLDEYINDCYFILNGIASYKELPKDIVFTVVHLCLAHIMKCFSFHARKHFSKRESKFILYSCSVIVNCKGLKEFKEAMRHLLTILFNKKRGMA